jgi:tol-pal system protein YbgF
MRLLSSRPGFVLAALFLFGLLLMNGPVSAQIADARQVADLEARILSMEEELRQLRGRVEEAEYQAREANQRIERLVADMDARLRGVEPPPAADGGEGAAAMAGATTAPATAAQEPALSRDEPGVLGTLPRDALLGLPEPPPEPPLPAGAAAMTGSSRERFDAGMARVKAGDWAGAEAAFASVVADSPDDPLAPNAAYWQAETYYARKQWPQAAASFARNVRSYGNEAIRAPDNVLKLGMSLARMGDAQKACAAFAEFDRRYPGAPVALKQMAGREKASAGCG